eukprot:TRINITY_DN35919_c0_g1_i1.p1 TRINITY_DN35919_c0_g1~~TRINITY_DN35919_c0_g1_i1.p1  ORF type:complete len:104 (-),score=6.91 TRINITY_DN35919_c0_g1_i1:33-344(-)
MILPARPHRLVLLEGRKSNYICCTFHSVLFYTVMKIDSNNNLHIQYVVHLPHITITKASIIFHHSWCLRLVDTKTTIFTSNMLCICHTSPSQKPLSYFIIAGV